MKVIMIPYLEDFAPSDESGIRRVIEAYNKYLPTLGVELVAKGEDAELEVIHAGMAKGSGTRPVVAMLHGLYWTADYPAHGTEYRANQHIVEGLRGAARITVPSSWVAETFQRDMRLSPAVIPHGIEWQEWQEKIDPTRFVLWNKNRVGDVCDPTSVFELAARFPKTLFVSTFGPYGKPVPENVKLTGVMPHPDMKKLIQGCGVYLATTKETFGIGILEAMASGRPILGFRHGGINDLVEHGINGYLASPGDYNDLAQGLAYCVQYHETLGSNGREMARAFTWQKAAEKLVEVFQSALIPEPPSVSVIIPTYNYAKLLPRAVESAFNQTLTPEKIIVVDDGSTDDTPQVAKSLKETYPDTVTYIRQNNAGVAIARNNGIAKAQSKYVCCLDADDRIHPDFLQACVSALEADPSLSLAYTGLQWVKPDGSTGLSEWPGDYDYDAFLQKRNQVPTCCVYRREMWERLGGYRKRYAPMGAGAEDAEFFLRAGACGFQAKKVDGRGLFIYSWLSGRVSGSKEYREPDWIAWHPWTKDGLHPFASLATPKKMSHPVRQYDEPLISVVIPVGPGHESAFLDALDSLEAQGFRKWEAIVVWDAGDFNLIDYPNDLGITLTSAYPYVKFIDNGYKNGAGAARNKGAEIARAPYLLFLDADDFLTPDALETLYYSAEETGGIAYSDYYGKSIVDPGSVEKFRQQYQDRLLEFDPKTNMMTVRNVAADYDCQRAQAQPQNPLYSWNLISSLVPAVWHREIGGFDEGMVSWEDWDYWVRMARNGYCFTHIEKPLLVYRFYTGSRRSLATPETAEGGQAARELLQYLSKKAKEANIMPCASCGQKPAPVSGPSQNFAGVSPMAAGRPSSLSGQIPNDADMIEIVYNSTNRGEHKVVGPVTHIDYRYRTPGESFLVHRLDIEANPTRFVVKRGSEGRSVAQAAPTPPTPPPNLLGSPPTRTANPANIPIPGRIEEMAPSPSGVEFDLQLLPGSTKPIIEELEDAGLNTPELILAAGVERLVELRGIGEFKAKQIVAYLERYMAAIQVE